MVLPSPLPARSTLADTLTQGILTLMRDENLQAGDRLPSVRDLSDRFQVAVPTLREAIRRLEAFGVVEVRHGAGIFVRAAPPPLMLANPHARTIDRKVILDLIDTRILFEPWCASVAAMTPDGPEVVRLGDILAEADLALQRGDDAALAKANMAFHRGVAVCSGNGVVAQVMTLLTEIYSSEQSVMLVISNQRRADHAEHRSVFDAIRLGNPNLARDRMRSHLQTVRSMMMARMPEEPGHVDDRGEAHAPPPDETREVPAAES